MKDSNPYCSMFIASVNAIATFFPVANSIMAFINELNGHQLQRKIKRLEDFSIKLEADLHIVSDRINKECVNREDFQDLFENITKKVVNERLGDKRVLFKNILLNTVTDINFDFDITERYLRILEQLSLRQILLLQILYNPKEYNDSHGKIIKDPENNLYQTVWLSVTSGQILCKILKCKDYELQSEIGYLYYNGLVTEKMLDKRIETNGNAIRVLDNLLTVMGRRFVQYVNNGL